MHETTVTALLDAAIAVAERCVTVVSHEEYAAVEDQACRRIPRDPDDWPTVGLALLLDAGIWTQDNDFLGCGVPTWTSDTLRRNLDAKDRGLVYEVFNGAKTRNRERPKPVWLCL